MVFAYRGIISYQGIELSLERALRRALPGYAEAYQWFIDNEGYVGPRPYGKHAPIGIKLKLAAQRGIQKPGGKQNIYALSVTSTDREVYAADSVSHLDDGTWVFQYCAHRRNSGECEASQEYNLSLIRCLEDGLPVGVFVAQGAGIYRCLGLAFVERFNADAGMFTLRGPVRPGEAGDMFSAVSKGELATLAGQTAASGEGSQPLPGYSWDDEASPIEHAVSDGVDERERRLAGVIRRRKQDEFRRMLLDAYDGRCAMSGYDAPDALQAAHIISYLGPKSQQVTNGLLLRADLHILYDRSLLSVNPEHMAIEIAPGLEQTRYREFGGREIRLPRDRRRWPSAERLAAQYSSFKQACELAAS